MNALMSTDEVVAAVFGDTDNPTLAVDHVFIVLAATYGPAWERVRGSAPIRDVKTVWGFQLSHFTHSQTAKRSIMWALKNLPDSAPSAIQFRNLCRSAPGAASKLELPRPPQDPAIVSAIVKGLKGKTVVNGMKDWAHRLKARHEAGEKLNSYQVMSYQAALGAMA